MSHFLDVGRPIDLRGDMRYVTARKEFRDAEGEWLDTPLDRAQEPRMTLYLVPSPEVESASLTLRLEMTGLLLVALRNHPRRALDAALRITRLKLDRGDKAIDAAKVGIKFAHRQARELREAVT